MGQIRNWEIFGQKSKFGAVYRNKVTGNRIRVRTDFTGGQRPLVWSVVLASGNRTVTLFKNSSRKKADKFASNWMRRHPQG